MEPMKKLALEDIPKLYRIPDTGCDKCNGLGHRISAFGAALIMCTCHPQMPKSRPIDLEEWAKTRGEWRALKKKPYRT